LSTIYLLLVSGHLGLYLAETSNKLISDNYGALPRNGVFFGLDFCD